jgi:hypothetical protein
VLNSEKSGSPIAAREFVLVGNVLARGVNIVEDPAETLVSEQPAAAC